MDEAPVIVSTPMGKKSKSRWSLTLRSHAALSRAARVEGKRSLETLRKLRDDDSVSAAVRRRCAFDILCFGYGQPVQQVRADVEMAAHHFVLRAPPVMSSAEEWERKYGYPDAIDVKPSPAPPEVKPHEAYQAPEPVAVVDDPSARSTVRGVAQGHVGGLAPQLNMNPTQVVDAAAPKPREETPEQRRKREAAEQREREISPDYRPPGLEGAIPVELPTAPGSFEQMVELEGHARWRGYLSARENANLEPGKPTIIRE